jgi:serine/threonine-protein kinase
MPSNDETKLGQLAIARGILNLAELLRCVEESGRSGRDLVDVIIGEGLMSFADIESLEKRIAEGSEDLHRELEKGQTMVMDELYRSRATGELETLAGESVDSTDSQTLELNLDLELQHEDRYAISRELGRGGMGQVFLAADRILRRDVALKMLVEDAQDEKGRDRLLLEAQVTGLLEHPSIVPVYDLRAMTDGEPFYTMRVVQEQSLEQILEELRSGVEDHSLTNLVSILRQVSLAIQYAHDLGVVHRDLKPENILVGEYGEVYVIDWGVAKIVSAEIGLKTTGKVVMGQLVGTPHYMSPEQARGDNDTVDERSDVYALGAILYEILTLQPMFDADHLLAILFQVVHDEPPRPTERAPERTIPAELEEVCLRALAKDRERRYQSAEAFADELELFLEGVKERERRHAMAEEAIEHAKQVRAVYEEVRGQYSNVLAERARERERVESWAPPEEKAALWHLEQEAEDLEVEIERRFGEVVRIFSQALVHRPEMPEARSALADLYWQRFREYESTGRIAQAVYFEGLVRQYNDGQYDELLEGDADLRISTEPTGASVVVYRFQQVERRLVEWRVAELGSTPVEHVALGHGSYVLEVSRPGYQSVNVPIVLERAESHQVEVRLYEDDAIPEDFVVVPGGPFISGKVTAGTDVNTEELGDYAIAKYPVTCGEYLEFLNALNDVDESRAIEHAPKDNDRPYFPRDDAGYFTLPEVDSEGDRWELDWPMIMVDFYDAQAYAQWRAETEGYAFRLPTLLEWEKAARGADGRVHAWGNHFDAAFCLMRASRRGRSTPASVGSFPIDRSPYGLLDVCGNVAEWTSTVEPGSDNVNFLGGASYNSFAAMCRLDFVLSSPRNFAFSHYGFRLAMDLT